MGSEDERHTSQDLAEHLNASKIASMSMTERSDIIKQILDASTVNVPTLGRLACAGLQAGDGKRARAWQLLLGYLPPDREVWALTQQKRRAEYASFCEDFMLNLNQASTAKDDDPLNEAQDSAWGQYFKDREAFEQIQRDVARTHQSVPFFSSDSHETRLHHQEMQRLLFVFSKLNPGLEYVQGMNELVAPLYMVFRGDPADSADAAHAEADTFFCFVNLLTMSEMRDLYCKSLDRSATGVKAVLDEFMQHLADADPSVATHLVAQNVDAHFFAFRWMTVLFAQDVEDMTTVQRVWDFLFGDPAGCKDAIMRFCSALILRRRTAILAAQYPEIVKVVQSCGRDDFDAEEVVNIAASLSRQYMTK